MTPLQQRQDALLIANSIRTYRADLKQRVKKQGLTAAIEAILDPTPELTTMRLFDLLKAVPMMGVVKAGQVMRVTQLPASKTLGSLTERQQFEVIASFSQIHPSWRRRVEAAA